MAERPPAAPTTPDRHAELARLLHRLKLPSMADTFAALALKAAKANLTHEAFLYELVQAERQGRDAHRMERLRHQSGLPLAKTFARLDLTTFPPAVQLQVERLRSGAFVAEAINIVAAGKPGVGKTHVLAAIGHELVQQGQPVLWTATATLVQRLLAAKRDLRLPLLLAQLDRFALVILDDIGYVQHDRDEMEVLFTLLAERYERRSVAITTNLVFSEWNRIFHDPMTTMAAIDRVVHHSVILDLMGMESYRAKAATAHQPPAAPAAQEGGVSDGAADPVA
jgi:DNA replication protein DnaC